MRMGYDSLHPLDIPLDIVGPNDLILTYVNHSGNPLAVNQAATRFPNNKLVTISSHGGDLTNVLDVERGAIEPSDRADIQNWCHDKVLAGGDPIIYCNQSTWPQVASYFNKDTIPQFWIALWNNLMNMIPGTIGHQFGGVPDKYDSSVIIDYVKGIDPVANQTPPTAQDIAHAIMSYELTKPDGKPIYYGDAIAATEYYGQKLTAKYAPGPAPKPAPPK